MNPKGGIDTELRARRDRRGLSALTSSPLVRKTITFNLLGLMILVAGLLYLNTSRDSSAFQRAASLLTEVELIADVFEAQVPAGTPVNLATADGVDAPKTLAELHLRGQSDVLFLIHQRFLWRSRWARNAATARFLAIQQTAGRLSRICWLAHGAALRG